MNQVHVRLLQLLIILLVLNIKASIQYVGKSMVVEAGWLLTPNVFFIPMFAVWPLERACCRKWYPRESQRQDTSVVY